MQKLRPLAFILAALFAGLSSVAGHAATAIAHDGLPIYFEVHGKGEKFLLLGPGTALHARWVWQRGLRRSMAWKKCWKAPSRPTSKNWASDTD